MTTPPVTYVCLLSHFTIASAQAIRHIKPHSVIAISSDQMAKNGVEARFRTIVAPWVPKLIIIGSNADDSFPVESIQKSAAWFKQHLLPLLDNARQNHHKLIANLTGATKAAVISLNAATEWDERHYTAEYSRDRIEVIGHPSGSLFNLPPLPLLDEARLLNDNVLLVDDHWQSVDPQLLRRAATLIYQDYLQGPTASVLHSHDAILRALWFTNDAATLTQANIHVADSRASLPPGPLQDFLLQLAPLDPSAVSFDGSNLFIPASRKHRWVRFIIGAWWEYLVYFWIEDRRLPAHRGVIIGRTTPTHAEHDSEADILVRRADSTLGLIECKVQPAPKSATNDIARDIGDKKPLFGKSSAAIALSPAFWWDVHPDAATSFRNSCTQRDITLIESEHDLHQWICPHTSDAPPTLLDYFLAPPCRPADVILREAESLLLAWQPDTDQRLQKLCDEIAASHPARLADIEQLRAKRVRARQLLSAAYKVGAKSPNFSWDDLVQQAKALDITGLLPAMEKQRQAGEAAFTRHLQERNRKRNGGPLSKVHPRPNQAKPTTLSLPQTSMRVPPPPASLHPNDIRALEPAPAWTFLLDETGANFGGAYPQPGAPGKFVGLLVNAANPGLPELPASWHAVECDNPDEIDHVVQAILDAPCGVIGLPVSALPNTAEERWFDGMRALLDWVLRLLPLNGPTYINVLIEARLPFPPRLEPHVVSRDAIAMLARAWPERAKLITLRIATIAKKDSPLNGYVDALAFTWGSSSPAARERLKRSGLLGTCLLNIPARELAALWDTWDFPDGLPPSRWAQLVQSQDAQNPASIPRAILDALARATQSHPQRWHAYLAETQRHLFSAPPDISAVSAMIEWLEGAKPSAHSIPPLLTLLWLTAKLACANHFGETERSWMAQLSTLSASLREETAPLCCHADLHLAVNATNRFDFDTASAVLASWHDVPVAVPGLRYWGQLHSSFGQHHAFRGDLSAARAEFAQAIAAFERLSDPAVRQKEIAQTSCYAAIAAMDDPTTPDDDVRRAVERVTSPLPHAAVTLAASSAAHQKYAHHLLLRWLVNRGDAAIAAHYLNQRQHWQTDDGHPWPLIQLYRAFLLHPSDPNAALELALDAAALAFSADQGPTVQLIGACCRAIAAAWGEPWPEAPQRLAPLYNSLPHAAQRLDTLAAFLNSPADPHQFLRNVLPFNFR